MAIVGGSADARGPVFGALFLVVLSDPVWSNFPQERYLHSAVLRTASVDMTVDGRRRANSSDKRRID